MNHDGALRGFCRRVLALCHKETLQIFRDPSSNLIAFVLPVIMLFIFGYGINLDSTALRIGLVLQDTSPEAHRFADTLRGSPYLQVQTTMDLTEGEDWVARGGLRGLVIVPPDFSAKRKRPGDTAPLQVITDGAEPNTAHFVENYVRAVWEGWQLDRAAERGEALPPGITLESRYWFNPSAESRNYLVPGSITIIMTVIGALLTSLVVAREWERGTMEALLASPVNRMELLLSKLIPYYALGVVSLFICVLVSVLLLRVPFRGSWFVLWLGGSLFLGSALGMGLLLSTVTRNQFNAAMAALNAAFLPAVMLSGFIYEIRSMPAAIQAVTWLIPAKYFVTFMQTLFQAGPLWAVLAQAMLFLAAASVLFLGLTALKTRKRLE
jgi:ABC-2 type transport system permease protein